MKPGKFVADVYVRVPEGRFRVTATGASQTAARVALNEKLATWSPPAPRVQRIEDPEGLDLTDTLRTDITKVGPTTRLRDAAALWLDGVNQDAGRKPQTRVFYRRVVNTTVLPELGHLRVQDLGAGDVQRHLDRLTRATPAQARSCRVVLRQIFTMCVQDGAITANPCHSLVRAKRKKPKPRALTLEDVHAVRTAIYEWRSVIHPTGGTHRDPSYALTDLFEVLIGLGLRISEGLAIRLQDLDFTAESPTLVVSGTLIETDTIHYQAHTKAEDIGTTRDTRDIHVLPEFVATALQRQIRLNRPEDFVFTSGAGGFIRPSNIRRAWREARNGSAVEWVTPHSFHRTVATVVAREAGPDAAALMLRHSDAKVTVAHYIEKRGQLVDHAELLERLFAPLPDTDTDFEV